MNVTFYYVCYSTQQVPLTALLAPNDGAASSTDNEIRCLLSFQRGFVFEYGVGKVYFYEKETPHLYKQTNIYTLLDEDTHGKKEKDGPLNRINCISVNPIQDTIVVTSKIHQLFFVEFARRTNIFEELGPALHRGPVKYMAVCSWKPLLMTAGLEDRTVRIWNYETLELILSKKYEENLYAVAMHPMGLYALVAFNSKLKFMIIMIDDLRETTKFDVRCCDVCQFSMNGHLFAVVNANVIQLYSVINYKNVMDLKGHNGLVSLRACIP